MPEALQGSTNIHVGRHRQAARERLPRGDHRVWKTRCGITCATTCCPTHGSERRARSAPWTAGTRCRFAGGRSLLRAVGTTPDRSSPHPQQAAATTKRQQAAAVQGASRYASACSRALSGSSPGMRATTPLSRAIATGMCARKCARSRTWPRKPYAPSACMSRCIAQRS